MSAAVKTSAAVEDPFKEKKEEYKATREPRLVDVAEASFLSASGTGEPGGAAFTAAVGALFSAAWTIRMTLARDGRALKVAPLEGLWWGRTFEGDFTQEPRETWNWKLLIRVPDRITKQDLVAAARALAAKGKPEAGRLVTLERFREGRSVQVLHVGPFADERPAIERMHALAAAEGLRFAGRHHEIYLSDMRRVAPEKLRTVIRVPVASA
jgi:hypothetical protein